MLNLRIRLQRYLVLGALVFVCPIAVRAEVINSNSPSTSTSTPKLSDDPRFEETWKELQSLNNKPSTVTSSVAFSIGNVHYSVPRNYISRMDNFDGGPQTLVAFKVSFPGFQPLTEATKDCFTLAPLYRPKGCVPVEFNISSGGDGSAPMSDDEHFKNASKLFLSPSPEQAPYGFELYESGGGGGSSTEIYRKRANGHTLVIHCFTHDIPQNPRAVCINEFSPLSAENVISYQFYLSQLKDVEQIDKGIRELGKSFVQPGEKQ
jgi:hypothetical protein